MKKYLGMRESVLLFSILIATFVVALASKFNFLLAFLSLFIGVTLNLSFDASTIKFKHFVFSAILALLFSLRSQVVFGFINNTYKNNFIKSNHFETLIIFLCSFVVFLYILKGIESFIANIYEYLRNKNLVVSLMDNSLLLFIMLMIFWSPYLLSLYPGSVLPDSISSINQALGNQQLSNHHPVVFTLFLKLFIKGFYFLGLNKSIFVYTLTQTTVVAGILTYFIYWLKRYKVIPYFRIVIFAYFAVAPVFPIYALNVQKDTLFTCYLFLFTLKCIDLVVVDKTNMQTIFFVLISGVFATFYRNNGIYVVAITLFAVSIILSKKKQYLHSIILFGSYCIVTFLLINPLILRYSVPTAKAESLGVPLQQVSRTLVLSGKMSKEDRKYLNQLLPISEYEKYSPMLVDSIKWNSKFNNKLLNDEPTKFLKVWASLLPQNLKTYIDAYLLNTYGFWAPFEKNGYGFLDTRVNTNNLNIKQVDLIKLATGSNIMQRVIEKKDFLGSGTLFCLMIIGFYLYWLKRSKFLWIGYLPGFLTWLSIMVATPVAFSLRYVFILAMSLPLFFCLPFFETQTKIEKI